MSYLNHCVKCRNEWTTKSGPDIKCPNCDATGTSSIGFNYIDDRASEEARDSVKFTSEPEGLVVKRDDESDTGDEDFPRSNSIS